MSTDTQHPLQPFCDTETHRYDLATPWFVNGFAFASDGHMAAWMPSEPFELPSKGKRPSAEEIMRQPLRLAYEPLPELPELPVCKWCGGLGYTIEETCEDCNGTGKVEHDCDCPHCYEEFDECEACNGSGKFTGEDAKVKCPCPNVRFKIAGLSFDLRRLHTIAAFGAVEVAIGERDDLWFRCGEVAGVLMSVRDD